MWRRGGLWLRGNQEEYGQVVLPQAQAHEGTARSSERRGSYTDCYSCYIEGNNGDDQFVRVCCGGSVFNVSQFVSASF